jgi:hypothetical protein
MVLYSLNGQFLKANRDVAALNDVRGRGALTEKRRSLQRERRLELETRREISGLLAFAEPERCDAGESGAHQDKGRRLRRLFSE